ncbi:TetR/AcrR family transcriptional regulator [Muricomes intestini]|jgi:AcrR family transcriptional regulator|uniref:TetR family transcriptional regulator n=1 Tax=Muricomes intestini TaxID=1796634 RepID=A0A4R3K2N5_9FIRM|nr:TetR/AcrR family transcriptional regulator [Muricomes intestini]TCS76727.1 TetR family transcriptional regulator [Muricomes intestini]HAX51743.1 hypothetical protein [Lachnospiraceae bacterium]HCR82228.1 hypothetical protein [Lachnospiraceae bacterium]
MPSDGAKTKITIINTAIGLFKDKGYQNVSIKDICDSLNIQRGTFYYHFNSKDAIIDSFYDDIEIPQQYQSKIITTDNCWLKLWLLFKPTIDWTVEMGSDILSTIIMINLQNGRSTFFPSAEDSTKENTLQIIKKGQREGQFLNSRAPLDIYHTIRNQILGICLIWCTKDGAFNESQEIHDSLISILQVESSCVEEEKEWVQNDKS